MPGDTERKRRFRVACRRRNPHIKVAKVGHPVTLKVGQPDSSDEEFEQEEAQFAAAMGLTHHRRGVGNDEGDDEGDDEGEAKVVAEVHLSSDTDSVIFAADAPSASLLASGSGGEDNSNGHEGGVGGGDDIVSISDEETGPPSSVSDGPRSSVAAEVSDDDSDDDLRPPLQLEESGDEAADDEAADEEEAQDPLEGGSHSASSDMFGVRVPTVACYSASEDLFGVLGCGEDNSNGHGADEDEAHADTSVPPCSDDDVHSEAASEW